MDVFWSLVDPLLLLIWSHPQRWAIIVVLVLVGCVAGVGYRLWREEHYWQDFDNDNLARFLCALLGVLLVFVMVLLVSLLFSFGTWIVASWTIRWTMVVLFILGSIVGVFSLLIAQRFGRVKEQSDIQRLNDSLLALDAQNKSLEMTLKSTRDEADEKLREAQSEAREHAQNERDIGQQMRAAIEERDSKVLKLRQRIEQEHTQNKEHAVSIEKLQAEKAELRTQMIALKYPEEQKPEVVDDWDDFFGENGDNDAENN